MIQKLICFIKSFSILLFYYFRTLGTPNDAVWPEVSSLPDFKPTFPQWRQRSICETVPELDDLGIDLLDVFYYNL